MIRTLLTRAALGVIVGAAASAFALGGIASADGVDRQDSDSSVTSYLASDAYALGGHSVARDGYAIGGHPVALDGYAIGGHPVAVDGYGIGGHPVALDGYGIGGAL